jgi:hypothetical protein
MTLKTMIEKGYKLCAWAMKKSRSENHIIVKLSKHGRFYEVHSPQVGTILSEVEFTEPVLLKEVVKERKNVVTK